MYYDMKKHDCGEICNREDVDTFYVGRKQWKTYWLPKYNDEALFEKDNYKTLCSAQKRRIVIMLSTGCDYCISQLIKNKSNEYDPLGFESFISGASFYINHPMFCPRILISNQAKEKLKLANRELRRPDCPCQRENFRTLLLKSTRDEIVKRCHNLSKMDIFLKNLPETINQS